MKKLISAVLSAAVVMTSVAAAAAAVPAGQAESPAARANTEILHEIYEAEDARITGAKAGNTLDDYHGTGYAADLGSGGSVSFEVEAPTSAKYGVKLRYTTPDRKDRTINLYVNGSFVRTVTLAYSINENTWAYQTEAVDLEAGKNNITYTVDNGNVGGVNIDRIALSWLYEAEEAEKTGTGNDNTDMHPGFSGTGFASGYGSSDYGRKFSVNVPAAGEYTLVMRYAAGQEDSACRTVSLIVNGEKTQCQLNSLRSWDLWYDHVSTVTLNAGVNTVEIARKDGDNGAINLDYITVKPVQWTYAGAIEKLDGNNSEQLTFTLDNCMVQITSVDKNAVKVWLEPDSRFESKYDSFAVVDEDLDPQKLKAVDKGDYYQIDTGDMYMNIQKDPFKITYLDKRGNVIMENENKSMGWTTDGELMVNNVLPEDEAFWGLGEKMNDFNRRGDRIYMWAVDTWGAEPDDSMPSWEEGRYSMATPYFVSSKGYSVFFDNTSRTVFDFGKTDAGTTSFGTVNPNPGGELLYYFIYGGSDNDSIKNITTTYTDLIGKSFFAPDYAYGNMQCHYGYTQSDVERVAKAYRDNEIPLDVIMVDIEWYKYLCTPTGWNSSNFPNPDKMISNLHDLNIRLGVIDDPNITNRDNNADFRYADSNNYFVKAQNGATKLINWPWGGASGLMDFFNPDARVWWGNQHDMILNQGVECFWLDMCEPSKYNADWLFWNEDGKSYGNLSEVKNALAIMHHQSMYNKLTEDGKRSFMTSRTGYSGSQRYTSIWTGDINCSWDSQHQQINNGISLSMSGYNYWGFDIGGFFGDASDEQFKRMVELATFTPVHRFHYMTGGPKEAYTHNAADVSRKYIGLRYRLMPYTYSMTADNVIGIGIEGAAGDGGTGLPITRPVVMNYPNDANTYDLDTEYMSGESFLIAPVVNAETTKEVYLPEGEWYDYADGKTVYSGNQTMSYDAPVDLLPVFVKAGSIIPMQPVMQYVGEKPVDEITLDVFPTLTSGKFDFVMYEDDGETDAYQNGVYTTTAYDCEVTVGPKKDTVKLNIGARSGKYTDIDDRDYMMQFHCADYANLAVSLDGKAVTKRASLEELNASADGYYVDKSSGICYVKTHDTAKAMTVELTGDTGTNSGIRLEAEEGTLSGCTVKSETNDGTVVGYAEGFTSGSKVTFQPFSINEAGKYPVYISYRTADENASVTLTCGEASYTLTPEKSEKWSTALALLALCEGENTITLSADKNIMIDRITVVPEIVKYTPSGTVTAEAEAGELLGNTAASSSGTDYSGKGYAVLNDNGNGVTMNVKVLTNGTYAAAIRYSEGPIELNVTAGDHTETVSLPAVKVGLWSEEIVNLPLKAGSNTVTVTKTSGNKISFDCMKLSTDPYALTQSKELQNSGFETGNLSGWNLQSNDGNPNGGYGIDHGDVFAGSWKLYFWDGDKQMDKLLTQTVTGLDNGRYVVRARIRVYNTNPEACRFELSGYDGDAVTKTDIPYTSIWTTLQSDIVEVKDGQLKIGFYYKAPGGSSMQIDDVTLWKVSGEAAPSNKLLKDAVSRAESYDKTEYTSDSWDKYMLALMLADEVLDDSAATSADIYGMLQYLETKEEALEVYTPSFIPGDVDGNGVVNVSDIMTLKNLIMNSVWTEDQLARGDMNDDGTLTVGDMLSIKNLIMQG